MPNQVSNSQAFDVVTVSAADRVGGGYTMPNDMPDGAYTFETMKVAPSKREATRSVAHCQVSDHTTGEFRFNSCLLFANLLAYFKTDAALVSAGHLEVTNGSSKWKVAATYHVVIEDGVAKFM